ncbi:MAG: 3-dehydroquinate synthase [Peptococcaceae bacterium]|nr:3-dehydroquinate synthase [Peptococcaceae bacterium]
MRELRVTLPGNAPERESPIVIGDGILKESVSYLRDVCPSRRVAVISDDKVWSLYGDVLDNVLRECGIDFISVVVPEGEKSKSLGCLESLYNEFCRFRLRRNDGVMAFGGGVIGDLAGFAAATYMRGVSFIQIPTTLMAQVDSSVGGKVAVNLPQGKNLVGSFYQPGLVIADTSLLGTLDKRDWDSGMAEVVKYAALGNERLREIFGSAQWTRNHSRVQWSHVQLEEIIYLSCASKAALVMEDERDTGVRALLNFGHTFAHALEKFYGFGHYRHGEAVARGMLLAAKVGCRLGVSEPGTFAALERMLENAGIDRRVTKNVEENVMDFLPWVCGDKKNLSEDISLVLLKRMGEPLVRRVRYEEICGVFD